MTEPSNEATPSPAKTGGPSDHVPSERTASDGVPHRTRAHGLTERGRVRRTRASGTWVALIVAAVLVVLMLIFLAQNTQRVAINFLWLNGRFPLGIALLFAAVAGVLMVALPGAVRIVQLRRALRKNQKEAPFGQGGNATLDD